MGVSYWLVPVLCGRALWSHRLALAQGWLWAFGMLIFSYSLHSLGLQGMPRRTQISAITYMQPDWGAYLPLVAIGGSVLFLSSLLYFLNMTLTIAASQQPAPAMPGFAESFSGPEEAPAVLDRWPIWVAVSALLILFAYGPPLYRLLQSTPFNAPGFQVW
jgi:cytochrome c oxidase subunit 1